MVSLVVAAAIAALFYLFVWTPQNARYDSLTNQLAAQKAEATRLQTLAATKDEKELEFASLSERIRLVEAKLPPERDIPRLLRQIQDVAAELKVKLTLLRPGPTQAGPAASPPAQPQPAGAGTVQAAPAPRRPGAPAAPAPSKYQVFRIDLGFEGTYADLMAYLGRLEDFPRFIVLKQISMTPGDLPRLKATLNAETFVLPREGASQP
jgi:Tfp pilus assembly protein PilO